MTSSFMQADKALLILDRAIVAAQECEMFLDDLPSVKEEEVSCDEYFKHCRIEGAAWRFV